MFANGTETLHSRLLLFNGSLPLVFLFDISRRNMTAVASVVDLWVAVSPDFGGLQILSRGHGEIFNDFHNLRCSFIFIHGFHVKHAFGVECRRAENSSELGSQEVTLLTGEGRV